MGLIVARGIRIGISFLVIGSLLSISFPPVIAQEEIFPKTTDQPFALPGDTIDITITIDGGTETLSNPADVMLIMDRSGSMGNPYSGLCLDDLPCSKIDAAKDAMHIFVDAVADVAYAGLVTYESFGDTSLDCGIQQMTDSNKVEINNAIDSFVAQGSTAIGRGMVIGILELLNGVDPTAGSPCPAPSTSRHNNGEDIRKVMILATDGKHNSGVDPVPTILQQAIDAEITVYVVGIGTSKSNVDEGLLKKIACDTDQFDDNLCIKISDPTNVCDINKTGIPGAVNDLDCPDNYLFAEDTIQLNDFYKGIADEISKPTNYAVFDWINGAVFDTIVPGSIKVLNCTPGVPDGTVWPHQNPFYIPETGPPYFSFFVFMDPVPDETTVCITFQAHVKDDFSGPFDTILPINRVGYAFILPPDATCTDFNSCLALVNNNINRVKISNGSIIIKNPWKPWLKTTLGDVGSQGEIGPINRDTSIPSILHSADYLVIGNMGIDTRFRTPRWALPNYGLINIDPSPAGNDIYGAFQTRYPICGTIDGSGAQSIRDAIIDFPGCNVFETNSGTYILNISLNSYDGNTLNDDEEPVVIFVNGPISITTNYDMGDEMAIIFVTRDAISVHNNVDEIDGIFITNDTFNSSQYDCGTNGLTNDSLTVNGAIYAFTELCFTRDLARAPLFNQNSTTPAELIKYEPKYLYLFQDIIGDDITIYREVAP